ncbi:MAG: excinuclease ABC subunit UvrC [Acidobacteriota bacterium]
MGSELFQAKLDNLPAKAGVYLFKDAGQKIIYIGKAKSLRPRVRSYFQGSRDMDHKTRVLTRFISDLEVMVTDNEIEALILESTLVKRHKPKFNVNLKDDKAFLHIKLTVNEPYPRVLLTRRVLNDGALYFGPYLPASLARNTVKIINRHFLLRTCDMEINGKAERPCLEYHIKRCLGPCVAGLCSRQEYERAVQDVILLLKGENEELIRSLTQKMVEASGKQHYEAAAFYRDRIRMVRDLSEKQKMILNGVDDVDIFAYYRRDSRLALQLFTLRNGRIVGKREFYWENLEFFNPGQFLRDALQQYYLSSGFVPREIHLPVKIDDQDLICEWLSKKRSARFRGRVRIAAPNRGEKHNLLLLVEENAKLAFETRFKILKSDKYKTLEALQRELDLPELPLRIEAFDVSNIQGSDSVASLVVCEEGLMKNSEYRKFKIRTVQGAHDFASIYETVHRRYRRVLSEEKSLPNLIIIDGGKGQLHFAYQALSELGIEDTPLVSLAKREEHIFIQGQDEPLILSQSSPLLHLFQEIRDEAHRFAVGYHRKRRSIRDFSSELDGIPGMGEKRKKRLLRNFGSVTRIRQASAQELTPFVGPKLAHVLKQRLG